MDPIYKILKWCEDHPLTAGLISIPLEGAANIVKYGPAIAIGVWIGTGGA